MAASATRAFGRNRLFALVFVLAVLNGLADLVPDPADTEWVSILLQLFGISAIVWFAIYAMIVLAWRSPDEGFRRSDTPVLVFIGLMLLVPVPILSAIALLFAGLYMLATSPTAGPGRATAMIALALTGHALWGRVLLKFFGEPLLALDTALAGSFAGLGSDGNVLYAVDGSTRFLVSGACASLANISLAIVLVVTLAQLLRLRFTKPLVATMFAAVIGMFLVNSARLLSYAYLPQHFEYLHFGPGRVMFQWLAYLVVGALAFMGVLHAARRQA